MSGVVGVNQSMATNDLSQQLAPASKTASPTQEPPPPAAFKNPQPCSAYFGQKVDTTDNASLYAPFTSPQPYDICGYKPAQLEGAYGLTSGITSGTADGHGVKIAIVDAYDSPTLLADAQQYFNNNDPSIPLTKSQFTNKKPSSVGNEDVCGASGWYPEQALDVESEHTMAPGAHIIFVGAVDCFDNSLLDAVNTAITSGASAVSNSWGDALGDLLTDAATKAAFDNTFMLANSTGVSVLFSSGDDGDNFADFGLTVPDYPATSPFITAVGGTSLEVGKSDNRVAEYGWSTAKQVLCEGATTNCGSATTPLGTLNWQAGGGAEPATRTFSLRTRQGSCRLRSRSGTRTCSDRQPLRVIPDMSMDADASTGMLIGLTQTFPNGTVKYSQFKEGGTSLASPLLAGVIADADQAAGGSIGFLNPTIYQVSVHHAPAFNDIVPAANPDATAVIRVDFANTVNKRTAMS